MGVLILESDWVLEQASNSAAAFADTQHEVSHLQLESPDERSDDLRFPLDPSKTPESSIGRPHAVRATVSSISSRALPWLVSLLIHGALLLTACLLTRWFFEPARPPAKWGGGGGGVSLVGNDADTSVHSGMPGVVPLPESQRPGRLDVTADDRPEPATASSKTKTTLAELCTEPDMQIIGASGSPADNSIPVFHHNGAAASAGGAKPAAGGSSATLGNAPADSRAGLPGALLGQGLPTPDYPAESRRRGEQGVVKVAIEVLPDGLIGDIQVVSDPGYPRLRQACLSASQKLRQFRFIPAHQYGKAVRDYLIIPFRFILQ